MSGTSPLRSNPKIKIYTAAQAQASRGPRKMVAAVIVAACFWGLVIA